MPEDAVKHAHVFMGVYEKIIYQVPAVSRGDEGTGTDAGDPEKVLEG